MELKKIFRLSLVAAAVSLTACGGDINISEGDIIDNSDNSTTNNNTGGGSGNGGNGNGDGGTTDPDAGLPGVASSFLSTQVSTALGQEVSVRTLSGRLTDANAGANGKVTLTNDTVWALEGPVFVGNDKADSTTLEIEAGTIILGSRGADYLVVSRDSDIEVNGTAASPVIMTSLNDVLGDEVEAGQWGGLVILGNAPSTKCPQDGSDCSLQVEGAQEGAVFGGTNDADSSGKLNYLVVKYAGFEIAPDNELNGITFGGVGSGTEVDYVQVHANADDGVEFFGGSVNAKHLVLTGNRDDSVDWDNGYNGKLQHVYVAHASDNGEGNRGIEGDGDGGSGTAFSKPMISNMTIVGNDFDTDSKDSEGVLLRDQTGAHIMNLLITGSAGMGECLEFDTDKNDAGVDQDQTIVGNFTDGDIAITHSVISCAEPFKSTSDDPALNLQTWFEAIESNEVIAYEDRANLGMNQNGTLTSESALLTKGGNASAELDAFFDTTAYVGAVGTSENDWRQGWAFGFGGGTINVVSSASGCPAGTTTVAPADGSTTTCSISGRITSNLTLTAGNLYALSGAVFVGGDNTDSATLTVEPGVTVFGESGSDYLVVSRGSQINANGTAASPITFTSRDHVANGLAAGEPGQWGGMIVLGNAPSTKCPQDGSTCSLQVEGAQEGAVFGGSDSADNSGTLRYVRVMHGGFEIAPDNELNGITFGGVGSGTTVEYVQVHKNADDGVEFFGGAVNAKYLVLTGIRDDSVDWDNGYQGKLQFVLAQHDKDGGEANRGIEGDGDGGAGTQFSNPMVANMTIIGNSFDTDSKDSEGVLLRDQTSAKLYNFVITGPAGMGECLEFDTDKSSDGTDQDATIAENFTDGDIMMTTSVIACSEGTKTTSDNPALNLETWFTTTQTGNRLEDETVSVLNGIFTTEATITATDVATVDSFFTTVDFIGAVKDQANDWTANWTVGLND